MCMICSDWKSEKMTNDQLVTNLFEMKKELGREHVTEIVIMLCDGVNLFSVEKSIKMFIEILDFCLKKNVEQTDSRPQS
ncbi:hypothetical protein LCGC14_0478800 [marine sediment metagenome]|uniref:Uncharacterized protein n=1 Tax=marine sediment metagenome TaxID=412755 RepID=A0A0F9UX12_9ZZZZ